MPNPNSWAIRKGLKSKTVMSQETLDKLDIYFSPGRGGLKGSMYCQMGEYEKLCVDHEHKWQIEDPEQHEKNVETFYFEWLPKAAIEFPEYDPDKMLVDMAWSLDYLPRGRTFFSSYTPYGIRKIDTYFSQRIQRMESMEEALYLEAQIIYCPHIHIKIKENLAYNLNNLMMRFGR